MKYAFKMYHTYLHHDRSISLMFLDSDWDPIPFILKGINMSLGDIYVNQP